MHQRIDVRGPASRGLALLAVLLLVAVLATTTMLTAQAWSTQAQRAREAELLAVGTEMRAALQSYLRNTPNGPGQLPTSLEDLTLDRRYPTPMRHLRRVYADPFTGKPEWGLIRSGTGIIGFHSLGEAVPLRRSGFPTWASGFEDARHVGDWRFVIDAPAGASTAFPERVQPRP